MKRRKIALVTINPENESVASVMRGVFAQSNAYGFDVAVISPMVHSSHYFKGYLEGELRIYDLINFDLFDGVIITPIPMQEEQNTGLTEMLLERFQKECHVPVVSVDAAFGDYDVVYGSEENGIFTLALHLTKGHDCKDIMVLTGPQGLDISNSRVATIRDALSIEGITLSDEDVIYGDFWYNSGEKLANDIADGRVRKPQAIMCTSDHMAIGLTNILNQRGIRVPHDIVVTGFGGTMEASMNFPPITTFEYDEGHTGAAAVNKLVALMDKEREIIPAKVAGWENICLGSTCGCHESTVKIRKKLHDYLSSSEHRLNEEFETSGVSLSELLDSYISEMFTSTDSVEHCMQKIYESIYLMKPYTNFYLCLNTDWLEVERSNNGYTDDVDLIIYSDMAKKLHGYPNHVFYGGNKPHKTFKRSDMLPIFNNELARMIPGLEDTPSDADLFDEPQVYYFTPLHIDNVSIGYVVLQNKLTTPVRMTNVYRNYVRYINNALEMSRAKDIILNISEHDQLTGLYNRRGMERAYFEWRDDVLRDAGDDVKKQNVLAVVIDMNNLKIINDTAGHEAGDLGIQSIAKATLLAASGREFTVRGGGDEFYLIGIGEYTDEDGASKIESFKKHLAIINDQLNKDTVYSAAAGFAIMPLKECEDYHTVLDEADVMMYVDKRATKRGKR